MAYNINMDFQKIERKWQARWEKAKLGKAERDPKKKKYFPVFAYVTVSGYMHTGHMRGYSYTDIVSRMKRLQGFNVLFPVGSHATGNGAIAKAQKIKERDSKWIKELKSEGATAADIKKVSDPKGFVEYFNESYLREWKQFGFIADWDRFISTTDPDYMKFIEWQFLKLKEKGLLTQKDYFATYCTKCGPVAVDPSEMDLLQGGTAEKQEYTLLKFELKNGHNTYLVAATLRPETIYGQTNLWVNPLANYVRIQVGREIWIGSEEFAKKLGYQKPEIKVIGKIPAKNLIGKLCLAPGIDRKIVVLPATFVTGKVGTGIVTSVPSDAPYDFMAIKDLRSDKNFGDIARKLKPIPIISSEQWGNLAALKICEAMKLKDQHDPRLESATQQIYKAGFHKGRMTDKCGLFSGMKVAEAKDQIKKELIESGRADIFYDLTEEVICRCGTQVIIKKVPNQWFIKYSDNKLTEASKNWVEKMFIQPDDYKRQIPANLDWFEDRACARQGRWLGTPLPFDKSYVIEAIADSTIYPLYYIIAK